MEWKKIITAIAALMLAYSLVGCSSNTTNGVKEVTTTEESKQNGNYDFTCDYMVDFGLYGNSSILIDEKTGVEYIIIESDKGVAITPRLKGAE